MNEAIQIMDGAILATHFLSPTTTTKEIVAYKSRTFLGRSKRMLSTGLKSTMLFSRLVNNRVYGFDNGGS